MKTGILSLFNQLTSVPTAPFYEHAVMGVTSQWIKKHLGKNVSLKKVRGGLIVSYQGAKKGPALVLAAHLDHPGFKIITSSKKMARAKLMGGLPTPLLPGTTVEAFNKNQKNNTPVAKGVLGEEPKDKSGLWTIDWRDHPPLKKPDFAILSLPPYLFDKGWVYSRSIDDLLGAAISLETMRRLIISKAKTNLTVLLNRAEEVGFIGALNMISSGELKKEDSYLSIECSRELPGSRPGKGPTIRLGDKACLFDQNLISLLDESATTLRKKSISVQRQRLTGGSCEATAYQSFGFETAGVAVPLVNYHNGWGAKKISAEKVRISDVENCVTLLVNAAQLFPAKALRGAWQARLKNNLAQWKLR